MILKDKKVLDDTMLKLVVHILKKSPHSKGYKVKTKAGVVAVTFDDIVFFMDTLVTQVNKGAYRLVKKCWTCGNFNPSGRKGEKGCCFPKNFTCTKLSTDFCSDWIPMTQDQKDLRRKLREHFRKPQAK